MRAPIVVCPEIGGMDTIIVIGCALASWPDRVSDLLRDQEATSILLHSSGPAKNLLTRILLSVTANCPDLLCPPLLPILR